MGHLEQFEEQLRSRIEAVHPAQDTDELIDWLIAQVRQSYFNGRDAGRRRAGQPKGAEAKPRAAAKRPRQDESGD